MPELATPTAAGWAVLWQDYRGWPPKKRPPIGREVYANKEEARRRKVELAAVGMTACVCPAVDPKSSRRRRPAFNSWVLSR